MLSKMKVLKTNIIFFVLSTYFVVGIDSEDIGQFWQVTDFHYDANYSNTGDPHNMCHKTKTNGSTKNIGNYGNYLCDAPWTLITSAIQAMYEIHPNPDFILWTGDSVPHVDDKDLNPEKVYTLIGNITDELLTVFNNVTIYPVLGNHDPYPSNMMPYDVETTAYYKNILNRSNWDALLDHNESVQFKRGGFYSSMISPKIKLLALNTDLYYSQDKLTKDVPDPADQLKWLDNELTRSEKNKEVVYIMAHVPPGVFELVENFTWFYSDFNRKYLNILEKHVGIIQGQFYGHEHTDSFRIMYDVYGKPSNIMFLSPAVTPWKSTLKGVGANNPSIRLYHYSKGNGAVLKYHQYYLNLTAANLAGTPMPKWTLEYDTSDVYGLDELRPNTVHELVLGFPKKGNKMFKHYLDFNSVEWKMKQDCNATCFLRHYCAITELDYNNYAVCMVGGKTTVKPNPVTPNTIQTVPDYLYYVIGGLGGAVFLLFLVVTFLCYKKGGRITPPRYKKFGSESVNSHHA